MSYADHARNLQAAIAEIKGSRVKETSLMMHDEIALIKRRVINEGKTAQGGSTGKYSEAVVPYWYAGSNDYTKKHAAFNIKGKQKELLKKKGYFASYKDFREILGRPIAFKNFSLTGNMWKNVVSKIIEDTATSTTYEIGSDDPEVQEIINYNKGQSGDFLAISESERALLRKLNQQRIFSILQKHKVA